MLLVTADCLPVVALRAPTECPRLAVLHVGWRGLLAGIAAAGARGARRLAAAASVGPGIGACCYEVEEDVARPVPRALRGRGRTRRAGWTCALAAERALREAGVDGGRARRSLHRVRARGSSSRTAATAAVTGRQGVIAYVA